MAVVAGPLRDARPAGLALLCRARGRLCALPLDTLVETMRPLPVTPVAGAPAFVRGVSFIRGAPVPVVDVGALLGAPEPPDATRFVSLRVGDRRVALALEEVLGFRKLASESLSALPPLLRGASEEAVSAVAVLDAELLLVLEAARLVPESLWSALDGGGSA